MVVVLSYSSFQTRPVRSLVGLTSKCKVGPSWQLTVWPGSSWQLSGYCQAAASVARSMGQYPEEGRRSGHLETAPVVTLNTATLLLHCDILWTLLQSAGWPRGWKSARKTLSSNILQQASYSWCDKFSSNWYVLSIPHQFSFCVHLHNLRRTIFVWIENVLRWLWSNEVCDPE